MSAEDLVGDGIIEGATLVEGDKRLVQAAAMAYRDARSVIDPIVDRDGAVDLALSAMIISDIRTVAFLVITPRSVAVAWRRGMFKKTVEHREIVRTSISSATIANGTASLSNARLLTLTADGVETRLAIANKAPALEARLLELLRPAR